jgi:hypothetical protein
MAEEEIIHEKHFAENPPEIEPNIKPERVHTDNMVAIGATEYSVVDYTLPTEETLRDAWSAPPEGSMVIGIDMAKAKDIWRERIRWKRKSELERLDTEFMKALEAGEATTQIVADKQVLRDAPAHPDIDAATTPDELKAVQPIPNVTIE